MPMPVIYVDPNKEGFEALKDLGSSLMSYKMLKKMKGEKGKEGKAKGEFRPKLDMVGGKLTPSFEYKTAQEIEEEQLKRDVTKFTSKIYGKIAERMGALEEKAAKGDEKAAGQLDKMVEDFSASFTGGGHLTVSKGKDKTTEPKITESMLKRLEGEIKTTPDFRAKLPFVPESIQGKGFPIQIPGFKLGRQRTKQRQFEKVKEKYLEPVSGVKSKTKLPKDTSNLSEEGIQHTMKIHNLTREEVLRRLGR